MSIAELAQKTLEYKNNTIKALQFCGADISDNAGLKDFEEAVYGISTIINTHYTEDKSEAYEKTVPANARRYAQLISVGGKTVLGSSTKNLCKDAAIGGVVNTPVDSGQEYPISYTGTILPKGKYRFYVKADTPTFKIPLYVYGELLAPDGEYGSAYSSVQDGDVFEITEASKLWIMTALSYTYISEAKYRVYYYSNTDTAWNPLDSYDGAKKSVFLSPDDVFEVSFSLSGSVILTTNFLFEGITDYTANDDGGYTFVLTDRDYNLRYHTDKKFEASIEFKYPEESTEGYRVYPMVYAIDSEGQPNLTEYVPYKETLKPSAVTEIVSKSVDGEVLETVAIPDAVKNDAGWGSGLSTAYKKYVNTYDFLTKKYTKQLSDVITIDGSNVYVTYNRGDGRCLIELKDSVIPLSVIGEYTTATAFKITAPFTAEWKDGKDWVAWINTTQDSINQSKSVFVIRLPSEYNDIAKANAWFKAMVDAGTPVQIQYPLYEPIVTPIEDNTYLPPKLIQTEAGGTITFENDVKEAVPSTVKYIIYKGEET